MVFGAGLVVLVLIYFLTKTSRVGLFWAAFILTRPLGATVGEFLDKPLSEGGLALSRPLAPRYSLFLLGYASLFFHNVQALIRGQHRPPS